MLRPLRIQFPGVIYHLMSLGDRREDVFRNDEDRRSFLSTLRDLREDLEKTELARLLRRHTPLPRQWIADRLHMDNASYISPSHRQSQMIVDCEDRPLLDARRQFPDKGRPVH